MSPDRSSFVGENGKFKPSSSKEEKRARKDAWKNSQRPENERMSDRDYSDYKKSLEEEIREDFLKQKAQENGWSVDDEKDYRRSLKEEEKIEQQRLALERERLKLEEEEFQARRKPRDGVSLDATPIPQNPDGSFNFAGDVDEKRREHEEELRQEEEQKQQSIQRIKEQISEKVSQIKDTLATALSEEDNGRPLPFPASFFATPLFFIIAGIIDSVIALLPIGGDFVGFIVFAIIWAIPCVLILSGKAYRNILFFLLFDFIFGATVGTIANVGTPILDALLDFAPEMILMLSSSAGKSGFASMYPPKAIKDEFNSVEAINQRKERLKAKANAAIEAVKKGGFAALKSARLGGRIKLPGDEVIQKILFFVALSVIAVFGPFGLGYLVLDTWPGRIFFVVLFLICLAFERINWLTFKNFTGIVLFTLFNSILTPVLNSDFVGGFLGANFEAVFKIILFIYMGLFTLNYGGIISAKVIVTVSIILGLVLITPYLIGTLQNQDKIQAQQDRLQAEAGQALENANLIERLMYWVEDAIRGSSGENIDTTEKESTFKYLGVKISSLAATSQEYLQGETVDLLVDFEGSVNQPTRVLTICYAEAPGSRIEIQKGIPNPESFPIQSPDISLGSGVSLYPRVICSYNNLPEGLYTLKVESFYRHNTSVSFSFRTISFESVRTILLNVVDTNDNSLEDELGGPGIVPESSSGPIDLEVSNSRVDGVYIYEDIMKLDENRDYSKPFTSLDFQLKKSNDDLNGEVQRVLGGTFTFPEGIEVECVGINNGEKLPHQVNEKGEWVSTFYSDAITLKEILFCNLYMDEKYEEVFLPSQSFNLFSGSFNVMYDYKIQESLTDIIQVR